MPSLSNIMSFHLARNLKAFLELRTGITRGPTPAEQARTLEDLVKRQARELRKARERIRKLTALPEGSTRSGRLVKANQAALEKRPFLQGGYSFRPVSVHDRGFHDLKDKYPYFGYVEVKVEGAPPFVMFSNNDDQVAQTYFWYGPNAFESLSLRIWRALARRSNHVFDVGAYSGIYALAAAQANPDVSVHCFEPIRRVFGRLLVNLSVNRQHGRIQAYNLALGEEDGEATMHIFSGRLTNLLTGASLVEKGHRAVVGGEPIETMRFDTFVERQEVPGVDLVKIDVEQAEKNVIVGMEKTLREHRPNLIVEIVSEDNLRDISGILSPHGYNFAVMDDQSQRAYVNDPQAHRAARNVLFSTMTERDLRAFCETLKPMPGRSGPEPKAPAPSKEQAT